MHRLSVISSLAVLLLGALGSAGAQNAYTARPMNVRAGPDREYPLVAQLGPGEPLDVHGCLSDWSWCDVSFDDNRGWVYAGGVSFVYEGQRVPLYSYAPRLGLPIITFSLGAYWDQYYRGRPWYSQRETWEHRRLPPHMRPAGRPGMEAQMPHERQAPMGHESRPTTGHERPMPMTHENQRPVPNARQPAGGHATPRFEERGRPGPPPGSAPEQHGHAPEQHGHAARPGGPPGDRGRSEHGDHGDRGDHGNRPPGSGR